MRRQPGIDAERAADRVRLDAAITRLSRTVAKLRATSRAADLEYKAVDLLNALSGALLDADVEFREFDRRMKVLNADCPAKVAR